MFETLSKKLSSSIFNIKNKNYLTTNNIEQTLKEVRIALLEADVALPVVINFIDKVKQKALGQKINPGLTPGQQFIKIVFKELINIMGNNTSLNLSQKSPMVILLVGLPGSGKTTTTGKLGKYLHKKYNKKILTTSIDIYRPAALTQLQTITKNQGIDFFSNKKNKTSIDILKQAINYAKLNFCEIVLVDTPGSIHVNESRMNEVIKIYEFYNPIEILLIVDAMTGQDIANTAKIFSNKLPITGVILTKVDSDTRGGVALSIYYLTGKSIKFLGIGEKINDFEKFYPERFAGRILGMGDILSIVETIENKTIENKIDNKKIFNLTNNNNFNLNVFLDQLKYIKNMGGFNNIISKLPIINPIFKNITKKIDEKIIINMEAIINSMTIKERNNPSIIQGTRKKRIANGSGTNIQNVNMLLKQYNEMQNLLKKINQNGFKNILNKIKEMIPFNFYKK